MKRIPIRRESPAASVSPASPALAITLAALLLLASAAPSLGFTIRRVPSEYATIQEAVTAAASGDSILIAPGTYTGVWNRGIAPGMKTVFIRGEGGAGSVVIDADGLDNGFTFTEYIGAPSRVESVTIRHGNPYGVYVYMTSPTIISCHIEDCRTGVLLADCDGLLTACTIEGCANSGIAVTAGSAARIRLCEILNNNGVYGAGIEVISANPTIETCTVRRNDASLDGGGIYAENSTMSVKYSVVTGNRAAGLGGGFRLLNGTATIDSTTVSRNSCGVLGGGVYGTGTSASLDGSILWGNCASTGHEIFIDPTATVHFNCSAVDLDGVAGSGAYFYASAIHSDPWFCDMGSCADVPTSAGNFHLAYGSPCYGGTCGNIGALSEECGETPTQNTTWGWIKASFR